MKHDDWKPFGCSSKREVYSNTILSPETIKTLKRQPNLTPKSTEKKNKKSPKVSRRKEIIKIRSEINEKEMKDAIVMINKSKSWFSEKIKKIDKPLARLMKKKREKTQINKVRNAKGEVTIDNKETQNKRLLWATTCQ